LLKEDIAAAKKVERAVMSRGKAGKKALIGAGIGGALGLAGGLIPKERAVASPVLGAVLALLGGIGGGLVGNVQGAKAKGKLIDPRTGQEITPEEIEKYRRYNKQMSFMFGASGRGIERLTDVNEPTTPA